ncbi:hypothetical protein KSP39_PZI009248 [Platanthera zijinensis]|uniref:Uncharacterized protein n=1 Tax=Platanthera zijinensis TaxID=2320716 RepID=A0AAP0BLC0_9ASPA
MAAARRSDGGEGREPGQTCFACFLKPSVCLLLEQESGYLYTSDMRRAKCCLPPNAASRRMLPPAECCHLPNVVEDRGGAP